MCGKVKGLILIKHYINSILLQCFLLHIKHKKSPNCEERGCNCSTKHVVTKKIETFKQIQTVIFLISFFHWWNFKRTIYITKKNNIFLSQILHQ